MNLGELIDRLKQSPPSNEVIVSVPGYPYTTMGSVASYRGYYQDLAIESVSIEKDARGVTVSELLKTLEDAIGKTFTGYKGGDFTMDRETRIWLSGYGHNSGLRIYAVEDIHNVVEKGTRIVVLLDSYS